MRDKLDDFNQSIEFINFNEIDNLLVKELNDFCIEFFLEFGIFLRHLFQVRRKEVHQSLGSGILNGDFDSFVRMNLQESIVIDSNRLNVELLKPFGDRAIEFPVLRGVFQTVVIKLLEPNAACCLESFT